MLPELNEPLMIPGPSLQRRHQVPEQRDHPRPSPLRHFIGKLPVRRLPGTKTLTLRCAHFASKELDL